ncbi:MAG: hypothetical protein C4550_05440 [Nitrospiraceae bacterium]|nr:MAG: hypothetical protein C4550_05440 [Nitrospiraceae bacterium]
MLLEGYKINVGMCLQDPVKIRVVGELTDDIGDVLPYLNATLKGGMYNHDAKNLSLKKDGRVITFHPKEIHITMLENKKKAKEILEWLKDVINKTYDNRQNIKPKLDSWPILSAMSLSGYLPNVKCEGCPANNCYAFARKLIDSEVNIEQCKPLFSNEYREKREKLLSLLERAGYNIPGESW